VIDLLSRADASLLRTELLSLPLVGEQAAVRRMSAPAEMAGFLVAYFGYGLLDVPSVRHAAFTALPLSVLNALCDSQDLPQSDFKHDAALILSTAPWVYSSRLPVAVSASFKKAIGTPIPIEYLPVEPLPKPPAVEELLAGALPPLLDYQVQMSDSVVRLLGKPGSKAMLQMPTGSGKTRTVMHAIAGWLSNYSAENTPLILWLAHSEELCEQAIASFRSSWSSYGRGMATCARLWGAHKFEIDRVVRGIVFAGLQKLHALRLRDRKSFSSLASRVSLLVFDEAHKALAETYSDLLSEVQAHSRGVVILGLSATPGRARFEAIQNERLSGLFGGKLLTPNFGGTDAITALRQLGVLAQLKRQAIVGTRLELWTPEKAYQGTHLDFPDSLLERAGMDEKRNRSIVNAVVKQARAGKQCIVFACSVDHAKLIAALTGMKNVPSCCVTGDMRHAHRVRVIDGFRRGAFRVLTNFGILSTGFDVPSVGVVVIARPTSSIVLYSQMIGRGLRGPRMGGNSECLVLDVVDNIEGFGSDAEVYSYFSQYWE
jgi:DNA repair protein RadD